MFHLLQVRGILPEFKELVEYDKMTEVRSDGQRIVKMKNAREWQLKKNEWGIVRDEPDGNSSVNIDVTESGKSNVDRNAVSTPLDFGNNTIGSLFRDFFLLYGDPSFVSSVNNNSDSNANQAAKAEKLSSTKSSDNSSKVLEGDASSTGNSDSNAHANGTTGSVGPVGNVSTGGALISSRMMRSPYNALSTSEAPSSSPSETDATSSNPAILPSPILLNAQEVIGGSGKPSGKTILDGSLTDNDTGALQMRCPISLKDVNPMTADRWESIHSEFARARKLILEGRGSLHELCEEVNGMGAAAKQWADEQAMYAEKKRQYELRVEKRNAKRKEKEAKEQKKQKEEKARLREAKKVLVAPTKVVAKATKVAPTKVAVAKSKNSQKVVILTEAEKNTLTEKQRARLDGGFVIDQEQLRTWQQQAQISVQRAEARTQENAAASSN